MKLGNNHPSFRHHHRTLDQNNSANQASTSTTVAADVSSANDVPSELLSLLGHANGNVNANSGAMLTSILQMFVEMIMSMLSSLTGNGGSTDSATTDTDTDGAANSTEESCSPPPPETCTPPEETCNPPETEEPPTETPTELTRGSAGLFGDPQFGVFTPNLGDIPDILKGFESGIQAGETQTILNDPDLGGLQVDVTGIQVDPNNTNSTGIGSAEFKSGDDTIIVSGDGSLIMNGQVVGNINETDTLEPITLPSGLTASIAQETDAADGTQNKRIVISNGEYKITAAVRKPHDDSAGYLDMNFEELTDTSANNATGYRAPIEGLDEGIGIPDLLSLEPSDLQITA